ncbi:hypothetical protein V8E53_004461 [Lactarius tabidus]
MALPNSTTGIELNLNMGTASPGLPMVALLLVPANISRVTFNLIPSPASGTGEGGGVGMVGLLMEPPPSTSVEGVCKEKEKPTTLRAVDKLPLQRTPKRGPTPSPRFKDSVRLCRLPPLRAPENLLKRANAAKAEAAKAVAANAVAGPSRLVVTGSPQVVAGQDFSRTEPETSDEEAERRKYVRISSK